MHFGTVDLRRVIEIADVAHQSSDRELLSTNLQAFKGFLAPGVSRQRLDRCVFEVCSSRACCSVHSRCS